MKASSFTNDASDREVIERADQIYALLQSLLPDGKLPSDAPEIEHTLKDKREDLVSAYQDYFRAESTYRAGQISFTTMEEDQAEAIGKLSRTLKVIEDILAGNPNLIQHSR